MALTFRTGSGGKGSALTIEELDNNFRHFTGSHEISGSLIVSSSLIVSGGMNISGSIIPTEAAATLGSVAHPFKDLFVSPDSIVFSDGTSAISTLNSSNIGNVTGSGRVHTATTQLQQSSIQNEVTFWYTSSGEAGETKLVSGSRAFTVIPSGSAGGAETQGLEVRISGSLRITGSASTNTPANVFEARGNKSKFYGRPDNSFNGFDQKVEISGSLNISGSLEVGGNSNFPAGSSPSIVVFSDLPTSDPSNAGQLYNDGGTLKVSAG